MSASKHFELMVQGHLIRVEKMEHESFDLFYDRCWAIAKQLPKTEEKYEEAVWQSLKNQMETVYGCRYKY